MRISVRARTELGFFSPVFCETTELSTIYKEANDLTYRYNQLVTKKQGTDFVSSANIHATAILHMIYQTVLSRYLKDTQPDFFERMATLVYKNHNCQEVLAFYAKEFPSPLLAERQPDIKEFTEESLRGFFVHQIILENKAFVKVAKPFINPEGIVFPLGTQALSALLGGSQETALMGLHNDEDIFSFLTQPAKLFPDSLTDQITYILANWQEYIPETMKTLLLHALSFIKEESVPRFSNNGGGKPELLVPDYNCLDNEYEAFTDDKSWMPNVVMIAKSTLVWLDQLTKQYGHSITRLDQIPDQELDLLHERGFTALWLIGLWERSVASKTIKNLCGNPDAEASAYSLKDYEIASSIGGWKALENLRSRCTERGIRLASDMVPNHTGIDGNWVFSHPEYFIQQDYPPFPSYTYNGPNLSQNPDIEIKLEDHYYDRSDAAVTFRRKELNTGKTSYIFHGNDGTSMPWNDTAQLDFLNPLTREAVFQQIRHVARNFSIIRFDAAMTLTKKHIRRLWYPQLGEGGDIAGRACASMSIEQFNTSIPQEFWREVVDRIATELPDTLLLAEAFWMMEGYFVRTLGMHRVYNSAFMNMLKNQENKKYRDTIKKTISFEPEILKRFVNFMSNPDEDTAIAQFGDGDKYFGVFTLLATMPGLPMIGHGQIEGYREKYGMEYKRAYWNETPNEGLVNEHYRRIFPLLRKRYLYSGIENFQFFDLCNKYGMVEESAYCYVNGTDTERSLVLYNNQYQSVEGIIKTSAPKLVKGETPLTKTCTIAESLGLSLGGRRFIIYTKFPTGYFYVVPSLQIFDQGCHFHLEGYETIVLTNIHEVLDEDGSYEELYNALRGEGTLNIEEEIAFIRLRPIHNALDLIRSEKFFNLFSSLLEGSSSLKLERKLILMLAESYAHLSVAADSLPVSSASYLPSAAKDINPNVMLTQLRRCFSLFNEKAGCGLFLHGAQIMEELPIVFAVAFILKPFLQENTSVRQAMEIADKLLLHRFFQNQLKKIGVAGNEARKVCHLGAILEGGGKTVPPGEDPLVMIDSLLQDEGVRTYVGCNEYQGVIWYRKETLQEVIFVSAISAYANGNISDASNYVQTLLCKEEKAGYRLEEFLKKGV